MTDGPAVDAFEAERAKVCGANEAIACSSGTTALHLMMLALGVKAGDQVIVPTVTVLATANAARYVGAEVIFADVDPTIAVFNVNSTQGRLDRQTWMVKVFGGLFAAFGAASLILASAGLYGVMAFSVRRRTQEIGIRMALGATQSNILHLVLKQGSTLLLIGIAFGLAAGLLLAAQLTQLLFRVRPWDPATIGSTLAVLAGAGLLACVVPARRASSVDRSVPPAGSTLTMTPSMRWASLRWASLRWESC